MLFTVHDSICMKFYNRQNQSLIEKKIKTIVASGGKYRD